MESHTVSADEDEFLSFPSPPALDTQKYTASPDNENTSSESEDEDVFIGYTLSPRKSLSPTDETGTESNNDDNTDEILPKRLAKGAGAPRGASQQRRSHLFTKLLCVLSCKKQEQDRRRELPFKLKKIINNANLHYFQYVTHKNCTYVEMVRRGESGHGDQRIIFTKEARCNTHDRVCSCLECQIWNQSTMDTYYCGSLADSGRPYTSRNQNSTDSESK